MNLLESERRLVDLLKAASLAGFELVRDDGVLLIKMASPCKEIGTLTVRIGADEIMLSCNVSHTHVTERGDGADFVERAAAMIVDLTGDRLAVSREFAPNGREISNGWCPAEALGAVSPAYKELVEKQYGGPSRRVYWFWSGKNVAL